MLPRHLDPTSSSLASSKRKCVPIKPPIPSKFQDDLGKFPDGQLPKFNNLVNFPGHMSNKPSPNMPDDMRCCIMCRLTCLCSTGGKNKKSTNTSTISCTDGKGVIHKVHGGDEGLALARA